MIRQAPPGSIPCKRGPLHKKEQMSDQVTNWTKKTQEKRHSANFIQCHDHIREMNQLVRRSGCLTGTGHFREPCSNRKPKCHWCIGQLDQGLVCLGLVRAQDWPTCQAGPTAAYGLWMGSICFPSVDIKLISVVRRRTLSSGMLAELYSRSSLSCCFPSQVTFL